MSILKTLGIISCGILFFTACPVLSAQTDSLPQYLFPKFTKGSVKMKLGASQSLTMNYNTLTEKMIFLQNGKPMEIANPESVDTVYLNDSRFIPEGKVFYELLVTGSATLFVEYIGNLESPGSPVGYGGTSQTVGPTSISKLYDQNGIYNLKLPEGTRVIISNQFWIRKGDKMLRFITRKQFLKIFPEKEEDLQKYINQSQIDFKSKDDLIKLVEYCNNITK